MSVDKTGQKEFASSHYYKFRRFPSELLELCIDLVLGDISQEKGDDSSSVHGEQGIMQEFSFSRAERMYHSSVENPARQSRLAFIESCLAFGKSIQLSWTHFRCL